MIIARDNIEVLCIEDPRVDHPWICGPYTILNENEYARIIRDLIINDVALQAGDMEVLMVNELEKSVIELRMGNG